MTEWRDEIAYLGGSLKAEQALITRMEQDVRSVVRAAERTHGRPLRAQHAAPLAGVRRALIANQVHTAPDTIHDLLMTNAERHHARDAWEATATMWAFGGHGHLTGLLRLATRLGPARALAIASVLRE